MNFCNLLTLSVLMAKIIFGWGNVQIKVDHKYSTLTMTFPSPNGKKFEIRIYSYNQSPYRYEEFVNYDILGDGTISFDKVVVGKPNCISTLKSGERNSTGIINLTLNISQLKRTHTYHVLVTENFRDIGRAEFIYKLEAVRKVSCTKISESWNITWSALNLPGTNILQHKLLLVPNVTNPCPPIRLVNLDVSCKRNSNNKCPHLTGTSVGSAGKNVCPDARSTENISCSRLSGDDIFSYIIPESKLRSYTQYAVIIQAETELGWSQPASCKLTNKQKDSPRISLTIILLIVIGILIIVAVSSSIAYYSYRRRYVNYNGNLEREDSDNYEEHEVENRADLVQQDIDVYDEIDYEYRANFTNELNIQYQNETTL